MMRLILTSLAFCQPAISAAKSPDNFPLNHISVRGTHNSYHKKPIIPFHKKNRYTHPPLWEQISEHGIRAFEFDLHLGFRNRLQVYHIAYIDSRTNCSTLKSCLNEIKKWTVKNPNHLPIFITLELKDNLGGFAIKDYGIILSEMTFLRSNRKKNKNEILPANIH